MPTLLQTKATMANLVMTRRECETIVVGDPADPIGFVEIVSIQGDRVRVSMKFPTDIPIHRLEVALKIRGEVEA